MKRRTFLMASSVGLVGLAGCTGTDGQPTTSTATKTGTSTTAAATETVDVPEDAVIEYGSLSTNQQAAFRDARNETVRFSAGEIPGLEKPVEYDLSVFEPFREYDYVEKAGSYYELSTGRSGFISGTRVEVTPVDTVEDEPVIDLDEETGEGVELIEAAIESEGNAAEAIRVDMPESIEVEDVVAYEGEYFRITQLSHRDYEYFTLEVR